LGVGWDDKAAAEGTISIVSVEAGSAGEKGGLRVGDRVLKFAGRELHGPTEFRQSVLAARSPTSALIERRGEDGPRELVIRLPGEPVQLGVGWRVDDAEPGTLIVNRLTPGSPADLAGIRPNDRIQRIGGQEFANAEEFQRAAAATDGPLVLEIETAGRVRTVEIPPLDEAPQDPLPEEANPAPRRPLSNPLRPQAK
jgi:S1-C subfamily serine protease